MEIPAIHTLSLQEETTVATVENLSRQIHDLSAATNHDNEALLQEQIAQLAALRDRLSTALKLVMPATFRGVPLSKVMHVDGRIYYVSYKDSSVWYIIQQDPWFRNMEVYQEFYADSNLGDPPDTMAADNGPSVQSLFEHVKHLFM